MPPSSSHSPCAACKLLRRKCTQECIFAPYFPPDQPQKFASVHKFYGASNVGKILNELDISQREDAVTSLAYEAEARLRDPVNGCVGLITILHNRLKQMQTDLYNAKKQLATYIGPDQAFLPILPTPDHHNPNPNFQYYNMITPPIISPNYSNCGKLIFHEPHQQQIQTFEAQQHQQELGLVNTGSDELINQINGDAANNNGIIMATDSLSLKTLDNPCRHQMQSQQPSIQYQL